MAKKGTDTPQEYRASHRFARISARKARLVIDLIRGRSAEAALRELKVCMKRAAPMISKVLRSAMANATQMAGLEPGRLYVSRAVVNEGSTFKRWRPRAMGRAYPRLKRSCHIEVSVAQASEAGSGKSARSAGAGAG
jgi:large subunit ribosomal protein L22